MISIKLDIVLFFFCWISCKCIAQTPTTPTNFKPDMIYSTSIQVSWDEIENYTYCISVVGTGNPLTCGDPTIQATSPEILTKKRDNSSLYSRRAIRYVLCAVDQNGQLSAPASFYESMGPPAPTISKTSSTDPHQIDVEWQYLDNFPDPDQDPTAPINYESIISYNVSYVTSDVEKWHEVEANNNDNNTILSTNLPELSSNSDYNISVVSLTSNPIKQSDPSNTIMQTTIPEKTKQPFYQDSSTTSTIFFQWDPVNGNAISLRYNISWESLSNNERNTTSVRETSTQIDNLNSNSEYNISVTAINDAGAGDTSDKSMLLTTPDKANKAMYQQKSTISSIYVKWESVGGTSSSLRYIITWDRSSNTNDIYKHSENTSETNYDINNLISNEEYIITVQAINNDWAGEKSDEAKLGTIPGLPNNLEVVSKDKVIHIAWNKPIGGNIIDNYTVEWIPSRDASLGKSDTIIHGKVNNDTFKYIIDDIIQGEYYEVNVNAHNEAGSGEIKTEYVQIQPAPPTDVKVDTTTTELQFTWKPEGYVDWIYIESATNDTSLETQRLPGSDVSCKIGGLKENTKYKVNMYSAVVNQSGMLEFSEYYIVDTKTAEPVDIALIVGLVAMFVVLIGVAIGGTYYYKKRYQPKKSNTASTRHIYDNDDFFPDNSEEANAYETIKNSRKIKLSKFNEEYRKMKSDSNFLLSSEFESLSSVGSDQQTRVASQEENKSKNRYKNILPYDLTRVKLLGVSEETESDYINASYISGNKLNREYIAAQGPLPRTTEDFWKLIWEQKCKNIVMVTQVEERGKSKCDHYWPLDEQPVTVHDFTITMTDENVMKNWTSRRFVVAEGSTSRNINHFHFTAWPDHGVPSTTESLVRFVNIVRSKIDEETEPPGPTVVHCSAGVGRTGTFIAMDRLLQDLQNNSTSVDVYKIVHDMRLNRPQMVQTEDQYMLLYQMVSDVFNKAYNLYEEPEPAYQNLPSIDPVYVNQSSLRK